MSAIHHAGGGEIDGSLNPEGYVFGSDFIECAAHRGDADIAVHAEGGGEQARDEFQNGGIAEVGHDRPLRNNMGTERNTKMRMQSSRRYISEESVMAKKMQANR